jgi:hypothetical protein
MHLIHIYDIWKIKELSGDLTILSHSLRLVANMGGEVQSSTVGAVDPLARSANPGTKGDPEQRLT